MTFLRMVDLDLKEKRVLIREDFNTPIKNGKITSDARIRYALPTIKHAIKSKARVVLLSHLGRPAPGINDEKFSLAPVASRLSELLGQNVPLIENWLNGVNVNPGQVVLCENVRFNLGEKENDEFLSEKMAKLCDIYVNDAFATAHRKEASTYGIVRFAKIACAGCLLSRELDVLNKVIEQPVRPLVAIVGGAKVSTKLSILKSIAKIVDCLIVGGGIANTFISAAGYPVGKSLYEPDLIDEAEQLIEMAQTLGVEIPLPSDVIVAKDFNENAVTEEQDVSQVGDDEMIVDMGSDSISRFIEIIKKAKTIIWNGPVGAFELTPFSIGTESIAKAVAESSAYSVVGGGDTIAAVEKYGVKEKISYISTGGGAFLTYLEGKKLPTIAALEEHYAKKEVK